MNVFITSLSNRPDGWLTGYFNRMKAYGFISSAQVEDCDVIFLPVSIPWDGSVFDEDDAKKLLDSKKPVIIFDGLETGRFSTIPWLWGYDFIAGVGWNYDLPFWKRFEQFGKELIPQIKLYFKRELVFELRNRSYEYPVATFEFPCMGETDKNYVAQSREEFNDRPNDIFMLWGWSNHCRAILHGELIKSVPSRDPWGKILVTDERDLNNFDCKGKVVVIYKHHTHRLPFSQLISLQGQSKFTITMRGEGEKCFRHSEASYNSTMAMMDTQSEWTYPWIDGKNCISLPVKKTDLPRAGKVDIPCFTVGIDEVGSVEKLYSYLTGDKKDLLYDIYVEGTKHVSKYRFENYTKDYVIEEINEKLLVAA